MDNPRLDKLIENVSNDTAFYTYSKGFHGICDSEGRVIYYKNKLLSADTLEKLLEKGEETTYRIGQVFKTKYSRVLLARISASKCCLINLKSGNRLRKATVVANAMKITKEELSKMHIRHLDDLQLVDNQENKV